MRTPTEIPHEETPLVITDADLKKMMDHYGYSDEIRRTIERERLLPSELLSRLQDNHPDRVGFLSAHEPH